MRSILVFIITLFYIFTKPITKDVLDYLNKDLITFDTYRKDLLKTACRLTVYSKIKYMWEKEILDQYLNKTQRVKDFVLELKRNMLEKCDKEQSSINDVFDEKFYVSWKESNDFLVNVDIDSILKKMHDEL